MKHAGSSHEHGFTYIGVLAFIAILGAGSALTLSSMTTKLHREQEAEILFIGSQFRAAIRSYYLASPTGVPRYPARLDELLRDPRFPEPRRHLRRLYVDPATGRTDWATVDAPTGGIMGVHSRSRRPVFRSAQQLPEWLGVNEATHLDEWVFVYVPATPALANEKAATPPRGVREGNRTGH